MFQKLCKVVLCALTFSGLILLNGCGSGGGSGNHNSGSSAASGSASSGSSSSGGTSDSSSGNTSDGSSTSSESTSNNATLETYPACPGQQGSHCFIPDFPVKSDFGDAADFSLSDANSLSSSGVFELLMTQDFQGYDFPSDSVPTNSSKDYSFSDSSHFSNAHIDGQTSLDPDVYYPQLLVPAYYFYAGNSAQIEGTIHVSDYSANDLNHDNVFLENNNLTGGTAAMDYANCSSDCLISNSINKEFNLNSIGIEIHAKVSTLNNWIPGKTVYTIFDLNSIPWVTSSTPLIQRVFAESVSFESSGDLSDFVTAYLTSLQKSGGYVCSKFTPIADVEVDTDIEQNCQKSDTTASAILGSKVIDEIEITSRYSALDSSDPYTYVSISFALDNSGGILYPEPQN
jgi:hypothetical protein